MSALIPFAKQLSTGRIVSVEEVPRGDKCGCICVFCDMPMQARRGEEKKPYFAHQAKLVNDEAICPASWERCVFWLSRTVLDDLKQIQTPDYYLRLSEDAESTLITPAKMLSFDTVCFPSNFDDLTYDTAILKLGDSQLAVTLSFEIAPWMSGAFLYQGKRLSHLVVTVDASELYYKQSKTSFRALIEEMIVTGLEGKHWCYHVRELKFIERQSREQKAQRQYAEAMLQYQIQIDEEETRRREQALREEEENARQEMSYRQKELLHNTETLRQAGWQSGFQCYSCKFIVGASVQPQYCPLCSNTSMQKRWLSDNYVKYLISQASKGFAERSLRVLPNTQVFNV